MTVRFASLGSGSKGNSTIIDDGETRLLIDLGFTVKDSVRRLARLEIDPASVDAILVTHEHADHCHGVASFARKFDTPVYLTYGTYQPDSMGQLPGLHCFNCHQPFQLGSFRVAPVAVPHDAKEPCQYVLSSGAATIGVLTDLGHITPHVREAYRDCDALLLECNHDLDMLREGPYPWPLKQRVGGDYGHLNNEQAAGLLESLNLQRLQTLVISHVSEQNNQPELALAAIRGYLENWPGNLVMASQDEGIDWTEIGG